MKNKVPQTSIKKNTLVVAFPKVCRVLSWASLRGGFVSASHWINHQVEPSYKLRCDFPSPSKTLSNVAAKLGLSRAVVGQMTSGDIRKFRKATISRKGWKVFTVVTTGFSNAVRVGEKAGYDSTNVGTINLLVWVSKPLALPTLLEILQIATEARTLGVLNRKVKSSLSDGMATGTGTDCIALACPQGKPQRVYAGKHTVLAELVGKAVLKVIDSHK